MREYIDIVENDLLEEDVHEGKPFTHFGGNLVEQWVNEDVGLVGGWRSGSSPANYLRVAYTIIDVPEYKKTRDESANYGLVECFKNNNNQLAALINIKLDKTKRKSGIGGKVVGGLVATYDDHFVIIDIQKSAVGFWKKMGVEFYTPNGREVINPSTHKGDTLLGVIRKPGKETPLHELPGFYKKSQ